MDTKAIVLEEIMEQEFQEMAEYWHMKIFPRRSNYYHGITRFNPNHEFPIIYSKITEPLIYSAVDYKSVIVNILENEFSHEICVNNHGSWVKYLKSQVTDEDIIMLADIAARDNLKQNYLEIKLKVDLEGQDRALIGFREARGLVISHEVVVPSSLRDLFTIKKQTKEFYILNGVWVPEGYNEQ